MVKENEILMQIDAKIEELNNLKAEVVGESVLEVETLAELRERVKIKPKPIKYETGIRSIDEQMNGLAEGSFIQLAGESFAGKTTLALRILGNISKYTKVLFFSFEMYENVLVKYLEYLNDTQANNLVTVQDYRDLSQMEKIISKYAKDGVRFIAIDSRMKIEVSGKLEEYQRNSTISRELSRMCQKHGVIILLINQMSDSDLKNGRLGLKGSGDQVYDSDVVLYVVVENKNTSNERRILVCDKDRINQRRWKADITENKPVIVEYNNASENKISIPTL